MSVLDQISQALRPHTDKMNQNIAFQSQLIHHKLHAIEQAILIGGRGDIGDKWQRFQIKKTLAEGETISIGACPINEMWLIQAIAVDGVQEKSPAFVINANGILIASVLKEGVGFEGIGADQVILPGEEVTLTARAAGAINCVLTIIRRPYPTPKLETDLGRDTDIFSPRQTHEINRDIIHHTQPDTYESEGREVANTVGRTD